MLKIKVAFFLINLFGGICKNTELIKIIKPHESTFNATLQYSLNSVSEKIMILAERSVDKDIST